MTNFVAFTPNGNHRGRDYSGAFKPGAFLWKKHHGGQIIEIDISATRQRQCDRIIETLDALPTGDLSLAFFCHGFGREIQLGLSMRNPKTFDRFCEAVARISSAPVIALYACSTGEGTDNRFADALRDRLCELGARSCIVLGHSEPGHAYLNAYKKRFCGSGSPTGGHGGEWWVEPGSRLWRAWKEAQPDLWWRLPWMTPADVHTLLIAPQTP